MPKFSDRLRELGFSSYEDYLKSPHWRQFKEKYQSSGRPMRCVVCGASKIQLHHHTYHRLGDEKPTDVTPLCRTHHAAVHDWLKSSGRIFVKYTREAVTAIGGQVQSKKVKKRFAKAERKRRKREKKLRLKLARQKREQEILSRPPSDDPEITVLLGQPCDFPVTRKQRVVLIRLAAAGNVKGLRGMIKCIKDGLVGHKRQESVPHECRIVPRVTPVFQPNAKATPDQDEAEVEDQRSRMRELLTLSRKRGK